MLVKSDSGKKRYFSKHQQIQRKVEQAFIPRIQKAILNQYKAFLKAIKTLGYENAKKNIGTVVNEKEIERILKDLYHKAAYIESNFVFHWVRDNKRKGFKKYGQSVGISLDSLAPVIDNYFDIYLLNRSALPITDTTRKYIVRHLVDRVDAGVPLDQAIQDFTELAVDEAPRRFGVALARASRIAVTESTRGLSFGGLIGAYMSGVDVDKVWITCDDKRVRGLPNYRAVYSHIELDTNVAGLFDAFYNGEQINYPGDPQASIENTANCRCAIYFREKFHPIEALDRTLGSFLNDYLLRRNRRVNANI